MRRILLLIIVALLAVLSLIVHLPAPVTPAVASVAPAPTLANTAPAVAAFVTAQPTADVVAAPVATDATAVQGVQPTTEPPHVVVVEPTQPQTTPQAVAQQGSASEERARLMRAELRLWAEYGLRVNINSYGVYTVRDAAGAQVDPSPFERMTISWVTANER